MPHIHKPGRNDAQSGIAHHFWNPDINKKAEIFRSGMALDSSRA
jgi:hypothetical protein